MNDDKNLRPFIAKTRLYHDIGTLPRPFLRRNLNQIFDSHERLLQGNARVIAEPDRRRRARWKPPTDAMMAQYCENIEPILTIDSFLLRPRSEAIGGPEEPIRKPPRGDGPDWLPHPDDRPIQCQVAVKILHERPKTIAYCEVRSGEILELETPSKQNLFEVRLQAPFAIAADQLNTPTEVCYGQSKYWERKMSGNYALEIEISCLNSIDASQLLIGLAGGTPADHADDPPNEFMIKAVWGNTRITPVEPGLPALPPDDYLLRLTRAKKHRRLDLPYGLQPKMSWNTHPGESVITQYNKHVRQLRSNQQMLTPSPSEDARPPTKKRRGSCSVRYHFWVGGFVHRSVHMSELRCIFCPRDLEHPSIERLYGHYATYHDHFSIRVEEDDKDVNVKVFKMQLKEGLQEVLNETSNVNFDWTAPRDPFDATVYMDRHALGEESRWETQQSRSIMYVGKKAAGLKTNAGRIRRGGPVALPSPARELGKHKTKAMPPEEVPELPSVRKRKHTVPHVPGIKFYRTTSKHVLSPGDVISDSDEDPDEFWLVDRQCHDLAKMGMDQITQDFHVLINRHMDEERPMSDMLVRDSVVRLARKHRSALAQPSMNSLFRNKLVLLKAGRVISEKDMEYCLQLVAEAATGRDERMVEISQEAHRRAKSNATDLDRFPPMMTGGTAKPLSPSPGQTKPPPFGLRTFVCRRTSGSRQKPYYGEMKELVKDEIEVSPEQIKPGHLCWAKFTSMLDVQLVWIRASDAILCTSNRTATLVTAEKDWIEVLEQAAKGFSNGPVVFELHPIHYHQALLADHARSPQHTNQDTDSGGNAIPKTLVSPRLERNLCVCGKMVSGRRGAVACGNPTCTRDFHMACVGMQRREMMHWQCPDCCSSS